MYSKIATLKKSRDLIVRDSIKMVNINFLAHPVHGNQNTVIKQNVPPKL